MTKRMVLTALVALAVPTAAQAHTTIIEPEGSHFPYQQWVDEAKVPTPDITLTLIEAPCPEEDEVFYACMGRAEQTIWVNLEMMGRRDAWPRAIFYHEIGHFFDYLDLPEWARLRFREIRHSGRPWVDEGKFEGLEEVFADSYSGCALDRPKVYMQRRPWQEYAPRVCHLIQNAYSASG